MVDRDEVVERLHSASRGLELSGDARGRHLEAVAELLEKERSTASETRLRWRRPSIVFAGAAAAVLLMFGTVTLAYSNAKPGSLLYGAKRVVERPIAILDHDLVATNRLDELQALTRERADPETIRDARFDAERAVAGRPDDDEFRLALAHLAWPAGTPRSVGAEAFVIDGGWTDAGGYTASLPTGHVVSVTSVARALVIETTGPWTVSSTAGAWHVTAENQPQSYVARLIDGELVVELEFETGESLVQDAPDNETPDGRSSTTDMAESAATSESDRPSTTDVASTTGGLATSGSSPRPPPTTSAGSTTSAAGTTNRPTTSTTRASTTTSVTTTTRATTSAPASTTTEPASISGTFFLRNPGGGDTSSVQNLSMSTGPPPTGSLGNYDTDRDGDPGLLIQKDGAGLSTSDRVKYQDWNASGLQQTSIRGPVTLSLWVAAKDFKTDETIGVRVALDACSTSCTRLDTAQWSSSGASSFRLATLRFGSLNETIPAGTTLRLRVVAPDSLATTDIWLAYDAVTHPSSLRIN